MSLVRTWFGASALTAVVASAHAQELPPEAPAPVGETCSAARYVAVAANESLDPALYAEVRTDLAAELAHRDYGLCSEGVCILRDRCLPHTV